MANDKSCDTPPPPQEAKPQTPKPEPTPVHPCPDMIFEDATGGEQSKK